MGILDSFKKLFGSAKKVAENTIEDVKDFSEDAF